MKIWTKSSQNPLQNDAIIIVSMIKRDLSDSVTFELRFLCIECNVSIFFKSFFYVTNKVFILKACHIKVIMEGWKISCTCRFFITMCLPTYFNSHLAVNYRFYFMLFHVINEKTAMSKNQNWNTCLILCFCFIYF